MANYANLKATINANIKANGNEEITGPILNTVLNQAVTTLGAGYQYMGVATPATSPGTPDANVFYIAATPGTYTNFGGKVVADGEVAILKYNGSWTKEVSGAATAAQVTQLGHDVEPKITDRISGLSFSDLTTIGFYNTSGVLTVNQNLRCTKMAIPAGTKRILTRTAANTTNTFEYIIFYDSNDAVVDFFYLYKEMANYPIKDSYVSVSFSAYKAAAVLDAIFVSDPEFEIRRTEDAVINKWIKELYLTNVPNDDIYVYVFGTTGQIVITNAFNTTTARLSTGTYNASTGVVTFRQENNSGMTGYAVLDKGVPLPSANVVSKQAKIIKTEITIERNPYIAALIYKGDLLDALDTALDGYVKESEFGVYEKNYAKGIIDYVSITANRSIDITDALRGTTTPFIGIDVKPSRPAARPIVLIFNGSTIVVNKTMPNVFTDVGDGWYYIQDSITLPETWTKAEFQIRTTSGDTTEYRNLRLSNSETKNQHAGELIAPYANAVTGDLSSLIYGAYNGKKLVCLGDSITVQGKWQPHLVEKNGVSWLASDSYPGINHPLALGGSYVLPMYTDPTEWTSGMNAGGKKGTSIYYMADYVQDCNPDVIIVFGGTNDITYIEHLGTINDAPYTGGEVAYADIDSVTFYGAYKGMLQKLMTQNPTAKIYAMTVMYPWYRNPSDGIGYFAQKKALINQAIRDCAALYSVEVIDLCYDSGIGLFNASQFYQADSSESAWQGMSARVHPNDDGAIMMANLISRHLR